MCYHDSKTFYFEDLQAYYATVARLDDTEENYPTFYYHNNSFDHNLNAVVSTEGFGMMHWGLIPWFTKSLQEAMIIRNQTCNCISEEMFEKPSFRDSLKSGKRCLVPSTGFFEWMHLDKAGKIKQPYYIHLKNQRIYSFAGIWSAWKNPETDSEVFTYSVLTTKANPLMAKIHNSKHRMPVIIPREYEKDWLNPNLSKEDVLALCKPLDENLMDAYTISKRITSRKEPTNVPEVLTKTDPIKIEETGSLF